MSGSNEDFLKDDVRYQTIIGFANLTSQIELQSMIMSGQEDLVNVYIDRTMYTHVTQSIIDNNIVEPNADTIDFLSKKVIDLSVIYNKHGQLNYIETIILQQCVKALGIAGIDVMSLQVPKPEVREIEE